MTSSGGGGKQTVSTGDGGGKEIASPGDVREQMTPEGVLGCKLSI